MTPAAKSASNGGFTDVRPPLAGAETWRQVVDRAGERCECHGQCGRRHTDRANPETEPHCPRFNGQHGKPLHAIPRAHLADDPAESSDVRVGWAASARLPMEELAAVCEACHVGINAAHAARSRAAAEPGDVLF